MLVLLGGCGYHFTAATENRLVADHTIWATFLKNETSSSTAQTVVRRTLLDESHTLRGLAPADGETEADLILNGVIRSITTQAVSYSATDLATEYRLTIVLELEMKRKGEMAAIWKGTLQGYQDYPADKNHNLALQRNAEEVALASASRMVAKKLFSAIEQSY